MNREDLIKEHMKGIFFRLLHSLGDDELAQLKQILIDGNIMEYIDIDPVIACNLRNSMDPYREFEYVKCGCGSHIDKNSFDKHTKTKKHIGHYGDLYNLK